jgi:hypothetical protein
VNARPVSAETRRACLLLAVAGTLVLMAGTPHSAQRTA